MSDAPLTAREFARLLRAFAHMIEAAAEQPANDAPKRRRRRRGSDTLVIDDVTAARAQNALRRIGVLP